MAKHDYSNEIKPVDVARYYLKSELCHVLRSLSKQIMGSDDIDNMCEQEVFKLCEALSIFYRLNSVWWVVGDPGFKWFKEQVPIESVRLTGMGDTEITRLIDSEIIHNDPIRLHDFLKEYYANLGDGKDKYGVKPSGKSIKLDAVLLIQQEDKLNLLDGSHRFIEQLLSDKTKVNSYVARPTQSGMDMKPVIGGGVYRDLVNVLEREHGESDKKMIRDVAELLTKYSGRDSNPLRQFPALKKTEG